MSFPPGYRFAPTDAELLVHYLKNKNLGHPLPIDIIPECNIYKYNPDQLLCDFYNGMGNEMYFFTQRERKCEGGSHPDIKAANGYWKATGGNTKVTDGDKTVGYKMSLKFHKGKAPKGEKTDWLMEEYRIDEVDPPLITSVSQTTERGKRKRFIGSHDHGKKMSGFVLCRIHKNRWTAKKAVEASSDQSTSSRYTAFDVSEIIILNENFPDWEEAWPITTTNIPEHRLGSFQPPMQEFWKTEWMEYRIDEVDPPSITNASQTEHGKMKRLVGSHDDHSKKAILATSSVVRNVSNNTKLIKTCMDNLYQPQAGIVMEAGGYLADFSTSNYNEPPQALNTSGCTPFNDSEILILNENFTDGVDA
ncbi:NAC transcription factor 29-like [Magnolia sinica]|uniref:NAC transcription factor 29-like n=1 Tax=Magnolia sinica TaxID=86752 RepID=UPI00265B2E14|nr:NAC transcription factor 29-like [Magnolia sinica]